MVIHAVVLAAGKSQRFAGIKQLAEFNGQTLIQHTLNQFIQQQDLLPGLGDLTVVVGANHELISEHIRPPARSYYAPNWAQGMGCSLADAVRQLPDSCTHVLVSLADQVALCSTDFSRLIALSQQHPGQIICAHYRERFGVPAIFPRQYFTQLGQLQGDQGARKLLEQYSHQVVSLALANAAIDVDTPADLVSALGQLPQYQWDKNPH